MTQSQACLLRNTALEQDSASEPSVIRSRWTQVRLQFMAPFVLQCKGFAAPVDLRIF